MNFQVDSSLPDGELASLADGWISWLDPAFSSGKRERDGCSRDGCSRDGCLKASSGDDLVGGNKPSAMESIGSDISLVCCEMI